MVSLVILVIISISFGATRRLLEYAPAPIDNPLKGLVPYQGDVRDKFAHSMEFQYIPYSTLVKGYDQFDWDPLEQILNDIAGRGHQAVFRVVLEYPGRTNLIPDFLIKDGLKVHRYLNTNTSPPAPVETPDYEDEHLRRSLKGFIAALGRQYDGDPRIGFITAGLLGTWGEWHDYPREDLFASKAVQIEIMDAYEAAFRITPILLRYPAGDNDRQYAGNASRNFGYHDDSFAWATLHTGKQGQQWFFMTRLEAAGPQAIEKWKQAPIGGEIRPEAWGQVFDEKPQNDHIQDILQCVEVTHVTWLMDSGMFRQKQHAERINRAMHVVRRMGYEFHVAAVTISNLDSGQLQVSLEVENRGVAPFYYDWRPEYAFLSDGQPIRTFPGLGKIKGLLPGQKPTLWTDKLDIMDVPAGRYTLAVRIPNPMKGGKPVRFANVSQDPLSGWLFLGEIDIPRPASN